MNRCKYQDKECIETDDCESLFVACNECKHMDSEGYCVNKSGSYYLDFVDGLAVCCKCFAKMV